MNERLLRIFTHESIVHTQIASIEKLLERKIEFSITINTKNEKSNIQFSVSENELLELANKLGQTIFFKSNESWMPYF